MSVGNDNGGVVNGGNGRRANANEQLYELLHVVFKRKRLIGALFLAITLPSILVLWTRKPSYMAKGQVLIASDRADVTISPTEADTLALLKLNESTVNSEVYIIQSRELLEQVARGLKVASTTGGVVGIANAAANDAIVTDLQNLTKSLKVTPIKASNVIEIDYSSSDPSYAAQVVNRVVDEYLAFHAMVHGKKGLAGFYDKQGQGLVASVSDAEENLRQYTVNEGMVNPTAEIQAGVTAVANLEGDLRLRRKAARHERAAGRATDGRQAGAEHWRQPGRNSVERTADRPAGRSCLAAAQIHRQGPSRSRQRRGNFRVGVATRRDQT